MVAKEISLENNHHVSHALKRDLGECSGATQSLGNAVSSRNIGGIQVVAHLL